MVFIPEAKQTGGYCSQQFVCRLVPGDYQQEEVSGLQTFTSERDPLLWSVGVQGQRKDGRRASRLARPTAALLLITKHPSFCLISAGTGLLKALLKRRCGLPFVENPLTAEIRWLVKGIRGAVSEHDRHRTVTADGLVGILSQPRSGFDPKPVCIG
jgi:hypothetical protein